MTSICRLLILLLAAVPLLHAEAPAPQVDYTRDIKPILAEKCFACHGGLKQKGKLRLDAASLITKGGRHGPVFTPGKSATSEIVRRVLALDGAKLMPPEGEGEKLLPAQVTKLRAWIDQGATMPDEPVPADPRQHWAYQLPVQARPPAAASRNPIDGFLEAAQKQHGLVPLGPAEKSVLLRRVYLDLIGLPPTPAEVDAFLADTSSDAYEKVVDRLLGSPRHGERWGRHWMDVWRYSDWAGYGNEIRDSQRHIWRWRDWIVAALNEDKGYDRMIVEMLAADELAPRDERALAATGFLARNWYKFNRHHWLDNTVEHTMKAFLGVTINCSKCHDHKYDPIDQRAYYELRAFFEPHQIRTDRVPGQADVTKDGLPRAYDADVKAPTYRFLRGDEKKPDKTAPIEPAVPEALGGASLKIAPLELPVLAYYPHLKEFVVKEMLEAARQEVSKAEAEVQGAKPQAVEKLAAVRAALAALEARIAADRGRYLPAAGDAKLLAEGALNAERRQAVAQAELVLAQARAALEAAQKAAKPDDKKSAEAIARATKSVEGAERGLATAQANVGKPGNYTPLGAEFSRTSSGRRLALARWIASRDNPLTARVAVNHIWLRHFGAPLADEVFDLGLRCPKPRQAALLDWLAVEFVNSGWSMKKLHRLIVTSAAYRRRSSARAAPVGNLERDPDNLYLWRMNTRRLEAEAVRDSVLHVAGTLDLTMGGPDLDQQQGQTIKRRSLYFRHAYEKKMKFLELFDGPSENECYRRSASVAPQQALALSNSVLAVEQARLLAARLSDRAAQDKDADAAFISLAYRQILCRPPSGEELNVCKQFLIEQAGRLKETTKLTPSPGASAANVPPARLPGQRARENLVHVLFNHNDFVTVR